MCPTSDFTMRQETGKREVSNSSRRSGTRKRMPVIRYLVLLLFALSPGLAFGAIAADVTVSKDGASASTSIASPVFTTSAVNEQLLAFISTDYLSGANTTVKTVTGAGLTWSLIKRTNAQSGGAEIWGAFAAAPLTSVSVSATLSQSVVASITVMSFAGVNAAGAIGATNGNSGATGAPTASLVTTGSNSWVLGVGNDYTNATARTVGTGQVLIHQDLAPTGDTYWVQRQANAIPASGTTVTINDTAPTKDKFNLSIVELLATLSGSTYSISGTISPTMIGTGATVTLSGASGANTVADANGNYSFTGLANGSYTVTPSKTGDTFTPVNQTVTVNAANQTGINFTGQAVAYSISGTVSPSTIGSGATITLSGTSSASTVADANGNYSFTGLANGSYTVTPNKTGDTFTPVNQAVTVNAANQTGINFTAQAVASYSISGTVSPSTIGSGATVTLSGTSSASTVADANGNYSFAGLTNGSYTVTPNKTGDTFTPVNQAVTVNAANQTGINFTGQAVAYSISGSVGGSSCSGCTFVQSTHSSQAGNTDWPTLLNVKAGDALVYIGEFSNWKAGATVNMTDSHGDTWYRCDNNATSDFVEIQDQSTYGMSCHYTVNIAAWPTITAQPLASQCVSTSCTQVGGSFFELALPENATANAWATPNAGTSTSGSNNVNCGSITLPQANDFLMCDFNNASGTPTAGTTPVPFTMRETTVTAIETGLYSGSGTIIPTGTLNASGIAYTGITVAFAPSSGLSGATITLTGASTASTVADANGNYSFPGLANGSYTVTPSKSGYTFTPASLAVTISGSNQASVNFTAQAVGATWSISGTLSPTTGGSGATVVLSGASTATTVADANGNYTFTGLVNGSYTITPSLTGYTFTPAAQAVTINSASQTGINFTAQPVVTSWSVSGTIGPAAGGSGATVTLSGANSATTIANANGNYTFTGLANGSYTITPSLTGYTFTPASQAVTINGASLTGVNFTAQAVAGSWSISGTITPIAGGSGAAVSLTGAGSATTVTDANGNYTFSGLQNGSYTVTPTEVGYTFSPLNQQVTIANANQSGISFTAAASLSSIMLDVTTSQDGAKASTTIASPVFSTAAANELLLAFVAADYISGTNTTVTGISGGGLTWTLVQRANVQSGDSEIWEAFASSKLSGVSVAATVSQSVISSITVISFEGVNTSGTNGSGAIGATGSNNATTGAPTASLVTLGSNSWVVGVGNDYDNATARTIGTGQVLVHQDLTSTGDTYWVQRETSAVPASGTVVTINDTAPTKDRFNMAIVEIIAAGSSKDEPPTVSMNSPVAGALVSGTVSVSAAASDAVAVSGVQFLLDGAPLGAEVTSSPYSVAWDTTTATTGPHTLSARATDTVGLSTTSAAIAVTVGNSTQAPVTGNWSAPVTLPAVAVNLVLLPNNRVMFYQDGTTPTVWDYLAGTFKTIPVPPDLFCSGHALLADGRILVVGGYGGSGTTIGIKNAEIFDPVALTWTTVPNMEYARWYPNATTLSDGRIIVLAGWQTTANTNAGISEIYDPVANTWTSLTNANNPFETYPFMYLMPDGRLIHIGGSEYATDTDVLDLTSDTWSVIDSRIIDGGSATMYLPGKFMKAGSASDSQESGTSSNTTFVLDMTQPAPAWRQTASMANVRSFMNLTMLPDGTVLATGGETDKNGGNIASAVYAAEMWSPTTQTWATMASMQTPREYHGTAVLLPDGRVLESGMGADFGNVPNELSAEFYSPPYLFKGSRPNITQAPAQIQYGTNFFVATPDAASIASVSLIRTGAVTHFFDQNERFLPLAFTQTTGGLTVTAPVNGNMAPPGYYMLFIVNSSGVPSIAPFVQIP